MQQSLTAKLEQTLIALECAAKWNAEHSLPSKNDPENFDRSLRSSPCLGHICKQGLSYKKYWICLQETLNLHICHDILIENSVSFAGLFSAEYVEAF